MSTEQLPDGLDRAVMLIDGARGYVIFKSGEDRCSQAIDAIRAEHHQRVTLQHHAADQAQRIAELEFDVEAHKSVADMHKRATKKLAQYMQGLFDAGEHQMDQWSFYGDAAVLHMQTQTKRIADLETKCDTLKRLHDAAADERDALRARLAEIEAQEPVAWRYPYRFRDIGETGACEIVARDVAIVMRLPKGEPLYSDPVPAQAVPDGWRLVPVNLTQEMRHAWDEAPANSDDDDVNMNIAYGAMIDAAPEHKA